MNNEKSDLNLPVPIRTPRGEIKIPAPIIEPINNAIPLIKLNFGFSRAEFVSFLALLSLFLAILFRKMFTVQYKIYS
jgi:hypothetical protein